MKNVEKKTHIHWQVFGFVYKNSIFSFLLSYNQLHNVLPSTFAWLFTRETHTKRGEIFSVFFSSFLLPKTITDNCWIVKYVNYNKKKRRNQKGIFHTFSIDFHIKWYEKKFYSIIKAKRVTILNQAYEFFTWNFQRKLFFFFFGCRIYMKIIQFFLFYITLNALNSMDSNCIRKSKYSFPFCYCCCC